MAKSLPMEMEAEELITDPPLITAQLDSNLINFF